MADKIQVAVRVRPILIPKRDIEIHWDASERGMIIQVDPVTKRRIGNPYLFDQVFQSDTQNFEIFSKLVQPLIDSAMKGFNVTVLAYGQTASGKTYTMMGSPKEPGIVQLAVERIFTVIENTPEREFLLRCSYIEIYNETISDLLSSSHQKLKVQELAEGNVVVQNLIEININTADAVIKLMQQGNKQRKVGGTSMNERSSRSHTIFRIIVESRPCSEEDGNDVAVTVSHINLVDLAGSEKAHQTNATGDRFREGCAINTSLSALSLVIKQLSEGEGFVNFRDSKLTHILRASLGGNARTAIICNVTPTVLEETSSTLKFASSAKTVQNQPQVNEVLSDQALLRKYNNYIKDLERKLKEKEQEKKPETIQEMQKLLEEKDLKIQELKQQLVVSSSSESSFVARPDDLSASKRSQRRMTWGGNFLKGFAEPAVENVPFPSVPRPHRGSKLSNKVSSDLVTIRSRTDSFENIKEVDDFGSCGTDSFIEANQFFGSPASSFGVVKVDAATMTDKLSSETPNKGACTPAPVLRERLKAKQQEYDELKEEMSELCSFTRLEQQIGVHAHTGNKTVPMQVEELQKAQQTANDMEILYIDTQRKMSILQSEYREKEIQYEEELLAQRKNFEKLLEKELCEKNKIAKELSTLKDKYDRLEQDKSEYDTHLAMISERSGKREAELRKNLQEAWDQLERLNQSSAHPCLDCNQMKLQVAELCQQNELLKRQYDEAEFKIASLNEELQNLKESQVNRSLIFENSLDGLCLADELRDVMEEDHTPWQSYSSNNVRRPRKRPSSILSVALAKMDQSSTSGDSVSDGAKKTRFSDSPCNDTTCSDEIAVIRHHLVELQTVLLRYEEEFDTLGREKEALISQLRLLQAQVIVEPPMSKDDNLPDHTVGESTDSIASIEENDCSAHVSLGSSLLIADKSSSKITNALSDREAIESELEAAKYQICLLQKELAAAQLAYCKEVPLQSEIFTKEGSESTSELLNEPSSKLEESNSVSEETEKASEEIKMLRNELSSKTDELTRVHRLLEEARCQISAMLESSNRHDDVKELSNPKEWCSPVALNSTTYPNRNLSRSDSTEAESWKLEEQIHQEQSNDPNDQLGSSSMQVELERVKDEITQAASPMRHADTSLCSDFQEKSHVSHDSEKKVVAQPIAVDNSLETAALEDMDMEENMDLSDSLTSAIEEDEPQKLVRTDQSESYDEKGFVSPTLKRIIHENSKSEQNQNNDISVEIGQLTEQLESKICEISMLRQSLEEANAKVEEMDHLVRSNSQLISDLQVSNESINRLRNEIELKCVELHDVQNLLEHSRSKTVELESKLSLSEEKVRLLEEESLQHKLELEALLLNHNEERSHQIQSLENECAKRADKIQELEACVASAMATLAKEKEKATQLDVLEKSFEEQSRKLSSTCDALQEALNKNHDLQLELSTITSNHELTQQSLEMIQNRVHELQAARDQLQENLDESEHKIVLLNSELEKTSEALKLAEEAERKTRSDIALLLASESESELFRNRLEQERNQALSRTQSLEENVEHLRNLLEESNRALQVANAKISTLEQAVCNVEESSNTVASLTSRLELATEEINGLKIRMTEKDSALDHLQGRLEQNNKILQELESSSMQQEKSVHLLEEQNEQLKAQNIHLQEQLDYLKRSLQSQEDENASMKNKCHLLETQLEQHVIEIQKHLTDLEFQKENVVSLEIQLKAKLDHEMLQQNKIIDLEGVLKIRDEELKRIRLLLSDLQESNDSNDIENQKKERLIAELETKIELLSHQKDLTEEKLNDSRKEIDELHKKRESLESELTDMNREVARLQSHVHLLQAENDQRAHIMDQVENLRREKEQTLEEFDQMRRNYREQRDREENLLKELDLLKQQIEKLATDNAMLEKERSSIDKDRNELIEEHKKLSQLLADKNELIGNGTKERNDLLHKIVALEGELHRLNRNIKEKSRSPMVHPGMLDDSVDALKRELMATKANNEVLRLNFETEQENCKKKIDRLEKDYDQLKLQYAKCKEELRLSRFNGNREETVDIPKHSRFCTKGQDMQVQTEPISDKGFGFRWQMEQYVSDNERLRKKVSDLGDRMEHYKTKLIKYKTMYEEMTGQVDTLSNAKAETSKEEINSAKTDAPPFTSKAEILGPSVKQLKEKFSATTNQTASIGPNKTPETIAGARTTSSSSVSRYASAKKESLTKEEMEKINNCNPS